MSLRNHHHKKLQAAEMSVDLFMEWFMDGACLPSGCVMIGGQSISFYIFGAAAWFFMVSQGETPAETLKDSVPGSLNEWTVDVVTCEVILNLSDIHEMGLHSKWAGHFLLFPCLSLLQQCLSDIRKFKWCMMYIMCSALSPPSQDPSRMSLRNSHHKKPQDAGVSVDLFMEWFMDGAC